MPQKFVSVVGPLDEDDASGVGCGDVADVTGLLTTILTVEWVLKMDMKLAYSWRKI